MTSELPTGSPMQGIITENAKLREVTPKMKELVSQGVLSSDFVFRDLIITQPLGEGGFGAVFEGIKPNGDKVAIKFMKYENSSDIVFNELFVFQNLFLDNRLNCNQKYLCLKDYINLKKQRYLVLITSFREGQTLSDIIKEKSYAPTSAARYVRQIKERLDELHNAGLVHSDIKPANIMVNKNKLYVLDFGGGCFKSSKSCVGIYTNKYISDPIHRYLDVIPVSTHGTIRNRLLTNWEQRRRGDIYALIIICLQLCGFNYGMVKKDLASNLIEFDFYISNLDSQNFYRKVFRKVSPYIKAYSRLII